MEISFTNNMIDEMNDWRFRKTNVGKLK